MDPFGANARVAMWAYTGRPALPWLPSCGNTRAEVARLPTWVSLSNSRAASPASTNLERGMQGFVGWAFWCSSLFLTSSATSGWSSLLPL